MHCTIESVAVEEDIDQEEPVFCRNILKMDLTSSSRPARIRGRSSSIAYISAIHPGSVNVLPDYHRNERVMGK